MRLWTDPEIKQYKQLEYGPLQELYERADIPVTDPEERAVYLVKLVNNYNPLLLHLALVQTGADGRPAGLNYLERILIDAHKEGKIDPDFKIEPGMFSLDPKDPSLLRTNKSV